MKIFFWGPEVTHHFIDTCTELQNQSKEPILFVTWEMITNLRKTQGWVKTDNNEINIKILNHNKWWKQGRAIIDENKDAIHIFWGFWTVRPYFLLILYSLIIKVRIVIMDEAYSTSYTGYHGDDAFLINWIKVKLRPVLYHCAALLINLISKDVPPCIMSISLIARDQFKKAGFKPGSVFPFGYFVNKDKVNNYERISQNNEIRLVFIGALIKRKGLDIAFDAMNILEKRSINVTLDIYGPGIIGNYPMHKLKNINYYGVLSPEKSQSVIAQYDLLFLPSYHEGWGVVVNEALMQGVPVIVSDRVGSKCIVENSGAGITFESGNAFDLANKIEKIALVPMELNSLRIRCKDVGLKILPSAAAKYLLEVFDYYFTTETKGEKPSAIWCD